MKKICIIAMTVLIGMVWNECVAQNAVTFWKDGVPTIVYAPDSLFFWNVQNSNPDGIEAEGCAESTQTEQKLMEMAADEESAPTTTYSETDSLEYDAMAKEVIALFAVNEDNEGNSRQVRTRATEWEDDLAQEAIRSNGKNVFEGQLVIEQLDRNPGQWGKTRYGGFTTLYNTCYKDGKRYVVIVFYQKGGFPNDKIAYLKLGQVNSGLVLGKRFIKKGVEYDCISVCIDDYIQDYGCVNFFPLLITQESNARNYQNPFIVKTEPLIPENWRTLSYGEEFGKINGVSVYCNTSKKGANIGGELYQCVELCKRYVAELNPNITRKSSEGGWGNAINWPAQRANDDKDPGAYLVFRNDGSTQIREGDIIVWDDGAYGHIGVVIRTKNDYVSVAHQNGYDGTNADPIGSTLKIVDGVVIDIKPGLDHSPIFKGSWPINYFIRMNNSAEEIPNGNQALLRASTTNMQFGDVETGSTKSMRFRIVNNGNATLTITSMSPYKTGAFAVDITSRTIEPGATVSYDVRFAPSRPGVYEDEVVIESNAADNPKWCILLSGAGVGESNVDITEGLVAYYPFNGNANDESGNGNDGTIIGNVELTTDRFGNSNSAYRFFGEPLNYISVPDNETLHLSTFTLNAWVYTDSEDYGNGYLINKGRDIENGSYRLCVRSVGATTRYGGSNDAYIDENPSVGSWHMITGTVEGDKAKYYLDGILKDERTLSTPFSYSNSDPLTLGMHYYYYVPSYWAYPLKGVLDDVRIYNRVLSSQEIAALAQSYFSNDGSMQGGAGDGSDPDVVPPTPGDDEGM